MKTLFVYFSMALIIITSANAGYAAQYWTKTFGGSGDDIAYSIQPTQDGGSIVAGSTNSFGADMDAWVLKLDSTGGIIWEKRYGSSNDDEAHIIQQTTDGGYIVKGCYDCDSAYDEDKVWLFKLTGTGDITWQKIFPHYLGIFAIKQTSDSGYILAGQHSVDFWVLKLESSGNVTWQKTYGKDYPYWEGAYAIDQTTDRGYIVAGWSTLEGCLGCGKIQVLKLDSSGEITWQNRYRGYNTDVNYIQQTEDGGYIIAGRRGMHNDHYDFFVLKLDSTGGIAWQKGYGGSNDEIAYSIEQTSDGGYIISGCYNCWDISSNRDIWFVKIDSSGNILGQKLCEYCTTFSLQQTVEGGYITAGVKPDGSGMLDVAVFNLDSNWEIPNCPVMEETTGVSYETTDYAEFPDVITQSISEPLTDTTVTPQDTPAETTVFCCYDIEDNDYDCVPQAEDNCPFITNPNQEDIDEDLIGDVCDNCPDAYNPNQEDSDSDDVGDVCDACPNDPENDVDSDDVCGDVDNCPNNSNSGQEDYFPPQGNDIGDACDCEGDFDCDGDCDGTDASLFKTDFGRSAFNNPCNSESQCNGDFDCDNDCDGTDAALFKVDFGRSSFLNPCPVCVVSDWCVYP